MRKKRLGAISTIIIVAFFAALTIPVYAAKDERETAAEKLVEIGLFKGDESGSLNLDLSLTRAELAVLLARLDGDEAKWMSGQGAVEYRRSVENYFRENVMFRVIPGWASLHVAICHKKGYVKGYDEYFYGSTASVDAKSVCTLLLRYLGYTEGDGWDYNTSVELANRLKLLPSDGMSEDGAILRGDVAVVFYNAIKAKEKADLKK
jgi:hypothetical protein